MPAELFTMLKKPKLDKILVNKDQSKYWSGSEKIMHVMRWSKPDIYNASCNCARHMKLAEKTWYNGLLCNYYRERVSA